MAGNSGSSSYSSLLTCKSAGKKINIGSDVNAALAIREYEINVKKESLQRRFETCSSIINKASDHCGKTRELAVGLFTASLPILLGSIITAVCSANCGSGFGPTVKAILYIYAVLMFVLLVVFSFVDREFYKRQAVYRVLKTKIQTDIFVGNFEETYEDEEIKYQFTLNAAKGSFSICHNLCGFMLEMLPYGALLLITICLTLFVAFGM